MFVRWSTLSGGFLLLLILLRTFIGLFMLGAVFSIFFSFEGKLRKLLKSSISIGLVRDLLNFLRYVKFIPAALL